MKFEDMVMSAENLVLFCCQKRKHF